MGALLSQEATAKGTINSNRNLSEVKISPIKDVDNDSSSLDNINSKKPNTSIVAQKSTDSKANSKDVIKNQTSRELTRKSNGLSANTSSPKINTRKGKLAPGVSSNTSKQSANKPTSSNSSAMSKDRVRNPPPSLMSPVKQPTNSANFTQNLELKLANNNEKVIEKVIKPLSRMACSDMDSASSSPTTSTKKTPPPPPLQTAGLRASGTNTVPASPIRISSLHGRAKSKPFEYSNRPGEKHNSISTERASGSKSSSKKMMKSKNTQSALSKRDSFEQQAPDKEEDLSRQAFSSSNCSNTDEIKDEAEVHDEETEFHRREEDDVSVADELSDDSGVHLGDHNDEDDDDDDVPFGEHRPNISDDMMAFSSMDGCDNWVSTTAKGDRHFEQGRRHSSKREMKEDWTATEPYTKERKYRGVDQSQSSTKTGLSVKCQSSSSLLTSENTSDPNIGMYALVGHSLKQGSGGGSGSVQGKRIKTSLPSSKQTTTTTQRNVKTSLGTTSAAPSSSSSGAKRGELATSRGGETSAFRNLKIAGDSIDLRLGTGVAAGTPLTSLQKQGGDRFFDESLDGFDNMQHNGDDESEDSLTLPLHSVAEELDEHTAAVTKLRMVLDKNIFISASLDSSLRIWGTEGPPSSRAVLDIPSFDAKSKKAMPTTPKPIKFCGLWVDKNCDFIWGGCSDGIIRVWNGGEGKPYRMVKGHEDLVTNIEGAPLEHMSAHTCASASLDKTARVWDTRAKKAQCALFRGHTDTIYSLKWLDGGRSVATASKDKTIKVWDVRTGR